MIFRDNNVVDALATQGTVSATPNPPVVTEAGPIKVFAGPREDPNFFDWVGFQRFIADFNRQTSSPAVPHFNLFTGVDSFLGTNIKAIVIEFPASLVLPPGSTKFAVWAVTYLGDLRADTDRDDHGNDGGRPDADDSLWPRGELRQVDRIGNPGLNTLFILAVQHDAFNFGLPQNDRRNFGPSIIASLVRAGVNQPNVLPVLVKALIPDTLKFDMTLADGYLQVPPNGRQLSDRTADFLLTLAFNVQGPPGTQHPGNVTCPQLAETAFSDCTVPKVYLPLFPFLGPPLQQTP